MSKLALEMKQDEELLVTPVLGLVSLWWTVFLLNLNGIILNLNDESIYNKFSKIKYKIKLKRPKISESKKNSIDLLYKKI